jgi:LemA protein
VARKRYNDSVRILNTKIRRFPSSSVANMMGFKPREYFEIQEKARETPKVDFGS